MRSRLWLRFATVAVVLGSLHGGCQQGSVPAPEISETRAGYTLANPTAAMLNATTPPVGASVAQANQLLRVFGIGGDNQIWEATQVSGDIFTDGSALPVLPVGIVATSAPTAILNESGILDVFVRGSDSGIYHTTQTALNASTFAPWSSAGLGGWSNGVPAPVLDNDNRVNVFVVGTDEGLWVSTETSAGSGTYSGFSAVSGRPTGPNGFIRSNPVPVRRSDRRIDVFFRVGDDSLEFARQATVDATTFTWNNVPSAFVGDPAPAETRVYMMSQASDIWEASDNGSGGYTIARVQTNPSGVTFLSSPVVVPGGQGTGVNNTVFVLASDRSLWDITRTSASGFGAWTSVGGAFNSGLTVVGSGIPGNGTIKVFSRGMARDLYFFDFATKSPTLNEITSTFILPSADAPATPPNVLTQRYNTNRTGANLNETVLNVANVNSTSFGKLRTISMSMSGRPSYYKAQVYAQPLYVPNLNMGTWGTHNALFVATEDNMVFAFDADTGSEIWVSDLSGHGDYPVPVPNPDLGCLGSEVNIVGDQGITSTPVIDLATNTLYVVDFACQRNGQPCYVSPPSCTSGADGTRMFSFNMHALDITNGGKESTAIVGTPRSLGPDLSAGPHKDSFNPKSQMQRPALLEASSGGINRIYVAFGSYADLGAWRGWVEALQANNLNNNEIFETAYGANTRAGIWMAGQGPAFDGTNVFLTTGNGLTSNNSNPVDYFGSAFVRMAPDLSGTPAKYQSAWFAKLEGNADVDLGSAGPVVIPNTSFIVGGGKQGVLTVLNRTTTPMSPTEEFFAGWFPQGVPQVDGIGKVNTSVNCYPQSQSDSHIHGSPVHWHSPAGDEIYVWPEVDHLKAFSLSTSGTVPTQAFASGCCVATVPTYGAPDAGASAVLEGIPQSVFSPDAGNGVECGMPGGMLSVSANGGLAGTGIVWALHPAPDTSNAVCWSTTQVGATLYALDAMDVSKELWDSKMVSGDDAGNFSKFSSPVVANGSVFVTSRDANGNGQIVVYGLRPTFNAAQ
jgi:hypothetical protein